MRSMIGYTASLRVICCKYATFVDKERRKRRKKHTFLYAPPDAVIDERLCALHSDGALTSQRDAEPHRRLQCLLFAPIHGTHEPDSQCLLSAEEARGHGHVFDPRQRTDDLWEPRKCADVGRESDVNFFDGEGRRRGAYADVGCAGDVDGEAERETMEDGDDRCNEPAVNTRTSLDDTSREGKTGGKKKKKRKTGKWHTFVTSLSSRNSVLELLDVFSQRPSFSSRVHGSLLVALGSPAHHFHVHLQIQSRGKCFFACAGEDDAAHGGVAGEAVEDRAVFVPHTVFDMSVGGWRGGRFFTGGGAYSL